MVILFTSINDPSSDIIINWLNYYGFKYIRLNTENLTEIKNYSYEICGKDIKLTIPSIERINLSIKHSIFFRRFGTLIYPNTEYIKYPKEKIAIENHLKEELKANRDGLYNILKDHNWIGNPDNACINKFLALKIAREVGLKVPNTIITNDKGELRKFFDQNSECIVKCISDVETFKLDGKYFSLYTTTFTEKDLERLPDTFFPSIFQNNIKKKYEIRLFYFDGTIFSMAIFSQKDIKTSTDYRRYNKEKQNRCVPFLLPKDIELKIHNFFKKINMRTGSVDLIKSFEGEYVFLEVNPSGQFGFVSDNCNYFIERFIATNLNLEL